jgi:hypothetical protein
LPSLTLHVGRLRDFTVYAVDACGGRRGLPGTVDVSGAVTLVVLAASRTWPLPSAGIVVPVWAHVRFCERSRLPTGLATIISERSL